MGETALDVIRTQIGEHGEVPVQLKLGYKVLFSSLNGSLPINDTISGELCGFPVKIRLGHISIPNTAGSYPVNTTLSGTIGDTPVKARLNYKIVFSTIAGNIPVNTGVEWTLGGEKIQLRTPFAMIPAFARGAGKSSGGGVATGLKLEIKYKKGVATEVMSSGDEGGPPQEAGRPVCSKLLGHIGDLEVDCQFGHTYYINTGSGRNPINISLCGVIRKAG
jgi:hypothetical protein